MPESNDQFSLFDLIPLEELQQFQDTISEINAVKSVIADHEGNMLTMPSNEIPICRILAQNPQAYTQCLANCQTLSDQVSHSRRIERTTCPPCQDFGILKAAVPIIVHGIHVASWWISQYCPERASDAQIKNAASQLGLDENRIIRVMAGQPQNNAAHFETTLNRISHLATRITLLGYNNLVLSRDVDKLHHVEKELNRYKTSFNDMIENRTATLSETNDRMQLEVLRRDLAEEQIERKTQLLDAINKMLQPVLAPQSDRELATRCLQLALKLTGSALGFIVEYNIPQASILARVMLDRQLPAIEPENEVFELKGIWKALIQTGEPVIDNPHGVLVLDDTDFPPLQTILAVPIHNQDVVAGFIALANKPEPYASIDLSDVTSLVQAFNGVLHRSRLEQSNSHSEKRLKLALDSANEGLWDYIPQTDEIYFSPRWYAMLGYSMDELDSAMETWHALTHPEDLPQLKETFNMLITGEETSFRIEIRMLSQDAQWRWIQVRGSAVERTAHGQAIRIVGTLIDISKYKQVELALQKANAELQRLAALDELTQIANRRRFDERLIQEWRRARRDHSPLAVVLCDIDHFKLYNDTYGHLKGDDTLNAVAQSIQAELKRSMDLVARFGGEEFAIILPNTDDQGAARVALEVKTAVEELKIEHKTSRVCPFITCSFGVASMIPVGDATAKNLVERADKALYQAKADGRNQIATFSGSNFQEVLNGR